MNSSFLARRLLRHCTPSDPGSLTFEQQVELAGEMSKGIAQYFRAAPGAERTTSASVTLPAPVTRTGISLVSGSTEAAAGSPFSETQRGSTILIDGDLHLNEIISPTGLLNPYNGPTGNHSAVIYGDCVPIRSRQVEKITTDPWITLDSGQVVQLSRVANDHLPDDR